MSENVVPLRAPVELAPSDPASQERAENERAVLGALIVTEAAYQTIGKILRAEYFAFAVHGRIYATIAAMIEQHGRIDLRLLRETIGPEPILDAAGGTGAYLQLLFKEATAATFAPAFARKIVDAWMKREIDAVGAEAAAGTIPPLEVAARMDAELKRIVAASASRDEDEIDVRDLGLDDWKIPPRGWLLGNIFCRRKVSSLIAPGAGGKTSLRMAQLMACATGRPLTAEHVFQRSRVLVLGFEDDLDEMRRLVRACMLHYGIENDELAGYFYIASLGAKPWKLAEYDDGGRAVAGQLKSRVVDLIRRLNIDIVSLDPLVKVHAVDENSNKAMDVVAGIATDIAIECDCAVDLPQHANKAGAQGDTEDANRARGASSLKDAFRLVYGLRHMSAEEAEEFGVPPEERRLLIRMDSAKVNIAPPSAGAVWFKLVGVRIGNASDQYPHGDEVQTVERWKPPTLGELIPPDVANRILDRIEAGCGSCGSPRRYSPAPQAKDRAAWPLVVEVARVTPRQAKDLIASWLKNDVLRKETYRDPKERRDVDGLHVNAARRPG